MNFKKLLTMTLALMMSISLLTACNEEDKKEEVNTTETSQQEGATGSETPEDVEQIIEKFDASELTAENAGTEILSILEKVESLHVSHNVYMDLSMMRMSQKMSVNMESDISLVEEKAHIIGNVDNSPLKLKIEMYVEKDGDDASLYANMNDSTWMRQDVKVADLKQVDGYDDAFEATKYYLEVLQNAEISDSTYEGKSAVLVTGVLDMEDPEGLMNNMGMQSANMGLNTAMFQQMLTGLEAVELSMYLDPETGLPFEVKVDMTDFMNSVYVNLGKVSGAQNINIDVKEAIGTIVFSEYNNVSVAVPEDVKNAVSGK